MVDTLYELLRASLRSQDAWEAFTAAVPQRFVQGLPGVVYDILAQAVYELGKLPSKAGLIRRIREWAYITGSLDQDSLDEITELVMYDGPVISLAEVKHLGYEYSANIYRNEAIGDLTEAEPGDVAQYLRDAAVELGGLKPTEYLEDQELAAFWEHVGEEPLIHIEPTGVDFIDFFTGGLVDGWVYSYLGSTGSAKTTVSIQLAVTMALKLREKWIKSGKREPLGKVFYVATEDGLTSIMLRMISFAAAVNRDQLSGKSKVPLTTADNLSDNDRALAKDYRFRRPMSETDRMRMMKQKLKANLRVVDLRDDATVPRGMHPVDYIRQQVHTAVGTDGKSYCALIIIDHCETLISRMGMFREKGAGKWELIEQLPQDIRDDLATFFDCPVWAVHQVSGVANEKEVGARTNHTDAKGSRSWGTYFHVCFSISKVDRRTNLCRLQITKNRDGAVLPDKVLRLIGETGTLREATQEEILQLEKLESAKKRRKHDRVKTSTPLKDQMFEVKKS